MKFLLLSVLIFFGGISCEESSESGDDYYDGLSSMVKKEDKLFIALIKNTKSDTETYEGIEKYYTLLAYYKQLFKIEAKMEMALNGGVSETDVTLLMSSIYSISSRRNMNVILTKLPEEYYSESVLLASAVNKLKDNVVEKYSALKNSSGGNDQKPSRDIDLSEFKIIVNTTMQYYQFYNNQGCYSSNELAYIIDLPTLDKCNEGDRNTRSYRVESISSNGDCDNSRSFDGLVDDNLTYYGACLSRIVNDSTLLPIELFSDTEKALTELRKKSLVSLHNNQGCYKSSLITRMEAPYTATTPDSCAAVNALIADGRLSSQVESYEIDGVCTNLRDSYSSATSVNFLDLCRNLYSQLGGVE